MPVVGSVAWGPTVQNYNGDTAKRRGSMAQRLSGGLLGKVGGDLNTEDNKALQAMRRRKARRESIVEAGVLSMADEVSRQPSGQLIAEESKLQAMLRTLDTDIKSRFDNIEKKLDILCEREPPVLHLSPACENPYFARHSTDEHKRRKCRPKTLPALAGRSGTQISDSKQPIPFRKSATADQNNYACARLPRPRTLEIEMEPLPPWTMNQDVDRPPGTPVRLEPSTAWLPAPNDGELDKKNASTAPTSLGDTNTSNRFKSRESSVSSVNSANLAIMRAQMTASRLKRGPIQQAIWQLLEETDSSTNAYIFSWFMCGLVVANVLYCILQTTDPPILGGPLAVALHLLFDLIFAAEVTIRFVVCPNRFAFFFHLANWIDLAAAAPLVLNLTRAFIQDEHAADKLGEIVVLCPLLRLCKLMRSFEKFHLLLNAFWLAFEALPVLLYTLSVLVLTFSVFIFFVEPRSNIPTLPQAMWLTIVTGMTVGYGDVVPTSWHGTVVVSVLIVGFALYMAIPLGIVGGSFSRVWEDRDRLVLIRRTRNRLLQWGYTPRDILQLFYLYDSDRSGELDLGEFSKMINEMRLGISMERVRNLFKTFDTDGSGKVDDEEFVRTLFPKSYPHIYQYRNSGSEQKRAEREEEPKTEVSGTTIYVEGAPGSGPSSSSSSSSSSSNGSNGSSSSSFDRGPEA